MKKDICEKIEEQINLLHSNLFYVVNFGYYLWVFKKSDDKMVVVFHGGDNKPYEIILVGVDNDKNISKKFDNFYSVKKYICNNLLDDMMMYEL